MQPRTAIGQTESGSILLLVVDGRAPGYSIGCTVGDCADILARYGAVQACNLGWRLLQHHGLPRPGDLPPVGGG